MLTCKLIIGLRVFVLQFLMELSMLAAAQPLIVGISMHLVEFIVIVVMLILKAFMPLVVLAIAITIGALRRCC